MPAVDQMDFMELYPLRVIKNKNDYEEALKSMEVVFDEGTGPSADYVETLVILIEHYEEENFPMKGKHGVDVVKFLMEQNDLKQKDLVGILGGKSTVSEILNGKRPLNLQHIRVLANKFHVKPGTFV